MGVTFRDDMQALMSGYLDAYRDKDASRCAAIFAGDAVIHSPFGPPIRGRDAIMAAHRDWFGLGEENKRIDILDCAASGDQAYCLVAYSADIRGEDGVPVKEAGTNLNVLVREAGAWRIRYSSMNETQPG